MAIETIDIPAVAILRVGKGFQGGGCPKSGCSFTVADLDELVQGYEATKDDLFPPVKLGHRPPSGSPAVGWLVNIRRVGDQLIADLRGVPPKIAALIKAGAYRARSLELTPKVMVKGKTYSWLATGLALLGAQLPAVDGLGDIFLSHRHADACGSCDSGLSPTEAMIAKALGLSESDVLRQKIKDANINEQGRQDGERVMRRLK